MHIRPVRHAKSAKTAFWKVWNPNCICDVWCYLHRKCCLVGRPRAQGTLLSWVDSAARMCCAHTCINCEAVTLVRPHVSSPKLTHEFRMIFEVDTKSYRTNLMGLYTEPKFSFIEFLKNGSPSNVWMRYKMWITLSSTTLFESFFHMVDTYERNREH